MKVPGHEQRREDDRREASVSLLPRSNAVFASLSEADRRRLAPLCERVHVRQGSVIADIGTQVRHAYFPVRGLISLQGMTLDGTLILLAAIRGEGVVAPTLFVRNVTPYRIVAPIPCEAYRMRAVDFADECQRSATLDLAMRGFRDQYATLIGQTAVCQHFHSLPQRVCRWILVCADCARSETIELTQDRLAQMLGASRVAGRLQDRSMIRQRHGRIYIVNRSALTAHACECYGEDRRAT
jgi:CRP-like cAMP-binding protein